jgi:hypothetical protein
MMQQRQLATIRRVHGAVAVARLAERRDALQHRAVVAAAVGLAIEVLLLAARFLG